LSKHLKEVFRTAQQLLPFSFRRMLIAAFRAEKNWHPLTQINILTGTVLLLQLR